MSIRLLTACALSFAGPAAVCAQTAELIVLPRAMNNRVPGIRGISGDGEVVFGMVGGSSGTPFRWRAESGYEYFPADSGFQGAAIFSCSTDGGVVIGRGAHATFGTCAFMWSSDGSVTPLQRDGRVLRTAYQVSGDGLTAVGDFAGTPVRAAYWTDALGVVVPEGDPFSGDSASGFLAVNQDGTAFGGTLVIGGGNSFRWTESGGPDMVGDLGGILGGAFVRDMNATGELLVGDASAPQGRVAFLWRQEFGIQSIPNVPGDTRPSANAVNADGRVVVGRSARTGSLVSRGALYYTEGVGSVYLEDLLNNHFGFSLEPAALYEAVGVSDDGRTIVGGGNSFGYWMVRLPQPALVDFNVDEFADFHDLISFLDCFEGNSVVPVSSADLNRDGFTDFFDLIEFIDNF